jgi:hypothetical protein
MSRSGFMVLMAVLIGCSSSTSTGGTDGGAEGGACAPSLGTPPSGCPDSPTAEAANAKMMSACGLTNADLDTTDANNPTLTSAARAKICMTCACRSPVYAYETLYKACTTADQANAKFAANVYALAAACN